MSVLVEQQVLQLEVAVDDALGVQVPERGDDLRAVEARALLAEGALARQVEEQLAAVGVLHHEAHAVRRLERVLQRLKPHPESRVLSLVLTNWHWLTSAPVKLLSQLKID